MRVVLMVSKLGHCLADLLWRWRSGELAFDIPCIISNHDDFRTLAEREGIPFHHLPFTRDTKAQAFEKIESLWTEARPDLIVLARYMQIVPARNLRALVRPDHEYPSLLSPEFHGRQSVSESV